MVSSRIQRWSRFIIFFRQKFRAQNQNLNYNNVNYSRSNYHATKTNSAQANATTQFTRQNSMTISTPGPDTRQMNIPAGTIVEEQPRKIRFAYLRSWLMSLLALVALPLGVILILVGTAISEQLTEDWVSTTARVISVEDNATLYTWSVNNADEFGDVSRDWQSFVNAKASGDLAAQVSLCDIASVVIVPREVGDEFNVWYDPQAPARHQCVPITQDAGTGYLIGGWILVVLSLWTFLRVFNRAAVKLARDNK